MSKRIRLLFITQKIHQNDDDLAFVILWVKQFIREGFDVKVVCLEKGDFDGSFPVYSLGKEWGFGKLRRAFNFLRYIFSLEYDRVFVHMNPEYFTLGGWYWFLRRIPMYLWYTHYAMHTHMRIAGMLSARMFAATKQSLPQYEGGAKKIVLGHGIDIDFWTRGVKQVEKFPESELVSVHRICRSKRVEIAIGALLHLPKEYNLTIYGRDVEKDYYQELQALVAKLKLGSRVTFAGPLPMHRLKEVYGRYRLMVNMAPETIDKTTLEGMLFGVYPVTTKGNAEATGLPVYPGSDSSEEVARFILDKSWVQYDTPYLSNIVRRKHSLEALVKNMSLYIKAGN